jgi:hypothetical protein
MSIKFPYAQMSARLRIVALVLAVLVLGSFGLGARARLKSGLSHAAPAMVENPSAALAPEPQAAAQPSSSATRLTSHLLTLGPNGFEPKEAVWPRGPFFLSVNNRSSLSDITLQIDRQGGGRLKEVSLKMRKQRSAGVLDPPPGRYVISEANHPEWTCQVTITPR